MLKLATGEFFLLCRRT